MSDTPLYFTNGLSLHTGDGDTILQRKVWQAWMNFLANGAAIFSASGGGSTPVGKQRTLASSNVTTGGTIAAGSVNVQFYALSSDFVGTINGVAVTGAKTYFWSPPPLVNPGDTYPAIPYTISSGNANLDVLT